MPLLPALHRTPHHRTSAATGERQAHRVRRRLAAPRPSTTHPSRARPRVAAAGRARARVGLRRCTCAQEAVELGSLRDVVRVQCVEPGAVRQR